MTRPACVGEHLDWHSPDPAEQEACKAICRRCPLRVSCLAGARARGERWGVWGAESFNPVDEITAALTAEPATVRVSVYAPAHGSRSRYVSGCRCQPCTDSNRTYVASRRLALAHSPAPVSAPVEPPLALFDEIPAVTARRKVTA